MMCAGVQNVSRPIVECHEISHNAPIGMHAAPKTTAKINHGNPRAELSVSRAATAGTDAANVSIAYFPASFFK